MVAKSIAPYDVPERRLRSSFWDVGPYPALSHASLGLALTRTSLVPKAAASCVYVNDMIPTT
jgi:hypothetical protein